MTVQEYLKLKDMPEHKDLTFIKARARKDAVTPFYHAEYQTTPIRTVLEWKNSKVMDYIVLNDKQPTIDWLSGCPWNIQIKNGNLLCFLVVSKEDLCILYGEVQATSLEGFIDEKLR